MFLPGVSVLLGDRAHIRGRAGLVTNHTGLLPDLQRTADVLRRLPGLTLVALFGPEHGYSGLEQAGHGENDQQDERTGLPIYDVYTRDVAELRSLLRGLDVLLYDIQDVGVRFYTYLTTLLLMMAAAASEGVRVVVLDRPNPIGGAHVEGPLLDRRFASNVGLAPVPIRYGLTVGEVARLANADLIPSLAERPVDLEVIPMQGWRRAMWYDQTGLVWAPPSPNLPTLTAATIYPGTCLFEGTNLSEGRGTALPFELIGGPWLDADAAAEVLNAITLPGVRFRAAQFKPVASKYAGENVRGVQVHVLDREALRPVETGIQMLATLRHLSGAHFAWAEGGATIDRLAGTDSLRKAIEHDVPLDELLGRWKQDAEEFARHAQRYHLYREPRGSCHLSRI